MALFGASMACQDWVIAGEGIKMAQDGLRWLLCGLRGPANVFRLPFDAHRLHARDRRGILLRRLVPTECDPVSLEPEMVRQEALWVARDG